MAKKKTGFYNACAVFGYEILEFQAFLYTKRLCSYAHFRLMRWEMISVDSMLGFAGICNVFGYYQYSELSKWLTVKHVQNGHAVEAKRIFSDSYRYDKYSILLVFLV